MGQIVKRVSKDGEVTYSARIRKRGCACKYATFSRAHDAKAWIAEEERNIRLGINLELPEANKRTLAEAIEKYREETKPDRYVRHRLRCWENTLGELFLANINEIKINEVCTQWKNVGWKPGYKLAPASLNRYLSSLSVVFTTAREWGWTRINPVRDAKRHREPRGVVRFLSEDERENLLKACEADEYKPLYLIVVLALSNGMRKGEIMSLTWKQIDLNSGVILLTKTKNGEARRVTTRGLALKLLQEHAKVRRIDSPFVFPGEKDSPNKECIKVDISERYFDIHKPWVRALKRAKVENFRFHDLRHSCASYLAMNGASPLEIAEVLGHKTLAMVKRYSHFAESHTAKVVENMNNRIFGNR